MSGGWKAKRFWKAAEIARETGGWGVRLDGRVIRTPARALLVVPSEALAQEIAAEWDAQDGEIAPLSMPLTRSANAAIDTVAVEHAAVAGLIAAYGASDMLCHRAEAPSELVERQAQAWDVLLEWAKASYGVRLAVAAGVMPIAQEHQSLARLATAVRSFDPFGLTALHDLVTLSGSLVIGLAVTQGRLDARSGWAVSRIDEDWQAERWGADADAQQTAERKAADFLHAHRFLELSRVRG